MELYVSENWGLGFLCEWVNICLVVIRMDVFLLGGILWEIYNIVLDWWGEDVVCEY